MSFATHYQGAVNDKISKSTALRMACCMQRWGRVWHEHAIEKLSAGDLKGAKQNQLMASKYYASARHYIGV